MSAGRQQKQIKDVGRIRPRFYAISLLALSVCGWLIARKSGLPDTSNEQRHLELSQTQQASHNWLLRKRDYEQPMETHMEPEPGFDLTEADRMANDRSNWIDPPALRVMRVSR